MSLQTLVLERPLPFDVRPEFFPELLPQSGSVHDVGLEGLRFLFPYAPYGGHHYEAGYNMIQFWEVGGQAGAGRPRARAGQGAGRPGALAG
jgi:hypothetical protein